MEESRVKDTVRAVAAGDTEAFGLIVGAYSERIFALVARICGNREDAEELTQDTFVKAFGSIGKFRAESSFSTWLYRIAYNTAISHLRKRKPTVPYNDGIEPAADDHGNADEERVATLEKALALMSPEERSLLLLFYHEDKSIREIAHIASMSEGNTKTKLHRARRKLADIFRQIEQTDNT